VKTILVRVLISRKLQFIKIKAEAFKKTNNLINEGSQEEGHIPTQHRKSDPSNNARRQSPTPYCKRAKAGRFPLKRAMGDRTESDRTGRYPV